MDILPGAERGQHGFILGHVGDDAQFDLGVIHREQDIVLA
jgi:hypothetical protein